MNSSPPQSYFFSSSSQFMERAPGDFISKTNLEQIIDGISHSASFKQIHENSVCARQTAMH